MATIDDRLPFVNVELGNRVDLTTGTPSRIQNWLWQSYLQVGMSFKFANAQMSVDGQWQQGSDYVDYPADCRAILNLSFFQQNGTAIRIWWKDIAYLRRYPITGPGGRQTIGPPSIIATFGQKIFIRPLCDPQMYNFTLDYWQKPQQDPNDIGATELLVPDDWLEVVDLGAMMRGHISLGERDKAQEIQQLLFGFTVPTSGKFTPGLMATMYNRRQAEAPGMDYNIQPTQVKRSYTNVGS